VVSANILAMESEVHGGFNIGCGVQTSLNELADLVKNIAGNDVRIIYEPPRQGDINKSFADISRAREVLGHTTEYTVKEGLEHTIGRYI